MILIPVVLKLLWLLLEFCGRYLSTYRRCTVNICIYSITMTYSYNDMLLYMAVARFLLVGGRASWAIWIYQSKLFCRILKSRKIVLLIIKPFKMSCKFFINISINFKTFASLKIFEILLSRCFKNFGKNYFI